MKKIVALFLAVIMLLSSAALAEGMTAGTYQASAQGYHGSIVLKVTVDADKITGIEVVEQSETEGIGAAALPMLVEAVLANQTIGVDAVTACISTTICRCSPLRRKPFPACMRRVRLSAAWRAISI